MEDLKSRDPLWTIEGKGQSNPRMRVHFPEHMRHFTGQMKAFEGAGIEAKKRIRRSAMESRGVN
jgi:hypothetical protein